MSILTGDPFALAWSWCILSSKSGAQWFCDAAFLGRKWRRFLEWRAGVIAPPSISELLVLGSQEDELTDHFANPRSMLPYCECFANPKFTSLAHCAMWCLPSVASLTVCAASHTPSCPLRLGFNRLLSCWHARFRVEPAALHSLETFTETRGRDLEVSWDTAENVLEANIQASAGEWAISRPFLSEDGSGY